MTALAAALALAACGSPHAATVPGPALPTPSAAWAEFRHLPGVVDLAGPRSDGSFLVAAAGRLFVLGRDGALSPFARGAGGYQTATGPEPYLVIVNGVPVQGDHCAFPRDAAFAIEPGTRPAVIMISPAGRARPFASLPPGSALTGIAFDATGRFGHKLLVTAGLRGGTTVFAIGCDGRLSPVMTDGPQVEGGIVVAPATFGAFGGDLIAPNETSGRVYAVSPSGKVIILARSGLPAGGDIGVESAASPRRQRPPRTSPTASREVTSTQVTTRSCGCPQPDSRGPGSGKATSSSPPKAARKPSTCAAPLRALSGTSPPGRRSPTRKAISFSRRPNAAAEMSLHRERRSPAAPR